MIGVPLEEGFQKGLDILFPPEDGSWWEGNFNHFNFDAIFKQIAHSAPKTMADNSFKEIKWVINSSNRNEPDIWNESDFTFFSEYFMNYVLEINNPRDEPEDYFRWYCSQMDRSDIEKGIFGEFKVVLSEGDDKVVEKFREMWNLDKFLETLARRENLDDKPGEDSGEGKLYSFHLFSL